MQNNSMQNLINSMQLPNQLHNAAASKRKSRNGIQDSNRELKLDYLCPVCFEILEEAHVTKCGHTFCYKCITESLADSNRCPQCNFIVDQFFPNFLLNEMISKFKKEKVVEKQFAQSLNTNQKITDLQKYFLDRYDELNLNEIDQMVDLLNFKKTRIEEDIKMKQNELLKEFLQQALKHKSEQFDHLKRELSYVEEDYKTLSELIKVENNSINCSETSEKCDNLPNNFKDETPNELNNDCTILQENSTDLAVAGCSTSTSSSTSAEMTVSVCDQTTFSSSSLSKYVPAFNSIALGECEHTDLLRKENEHKSESYLNVRRKKMNFYFHELEKNYFNRCRKDVFQQKDSSVRLNEFKETLTKFTHFSNLRPLASLSYAKEYVLHNTVSSIEFDKDSEFFAIAGVAKKIKIFDYSAVVKDSLGINYPVNEIECSSKISCLSWNSYYKAMMATSDYEGSVIIWDAFLGKKLTSFQEHEKRCWSVDFNKVDINLVASGSDDGKVKLWSANLDSSITTLTSTANICSVKFNPKSLYHLAFGSADHRVYYYDLRSTKLPLMVFKEHRKAVSYVKFLNATELVSASTDSQIKLWSTEQSSCLKSYKGHINEKNFVGLTAADDYIACGSENNSLYVYYKGIERQMLSFCFEKLIEKEETTDFVSAVCWRAGSNVLVAANSQGNIKVYLVQSTVESFDGDNHSQRKFNFIKQPLQKIIWLF